MSVLVLVSSLRCKEDFLCSSPVTFPSAISKTLRAQQGCSGLLGLHEALALVRVSAAGIAHRDKGNMELSCPEMMEGPLQVGDERRGVGGGA